MRVLIVDDSAFMRRTLSQLIGSDPELQVVDTARNGEEGLEKAKKLHPDIVTLDIEMPIMDGLTALRRIRSECVPPPAVLMCSSLTSEGSREALKALRLGASDFIVKQTSLAGLQGVRDEVVGKLKAIGAGLKSAGSHPAPAMHVRESHAASAASIRGKAHDLILIGSSTGGPPVLEKLINALPAGLRVPVVVAQHMPALFTQSLSARLGETAQVPVRHATENVALDAGTVYIIQGGRHGNVQRVGGRLALKVTDEPKGLLYKPSVDELFRSGAHAVGSRALAFILTGMGEDGVLGARDLHEAGAAMVAQDGSTCVVYGMPRAVVDANLATAVMTPDEMVSVFSGLSGSETKRSNAA